MMKQDDHYWREKLTPEQYRVLREKGTERPHTGEYNDHFTNGTYICAGCQTVLFVSDNKFNAGCGWPSFDAPADASAIQEEFDETHGMRRTEVLCKACGGHLGHVFPDGPRETTGMRYCINSASLGFLPDKNEVDE